MLKAKIFCSFDVNAPILLMSKKKKKKRKNILEGDFYLPWLPACHKSRVMCLVYCKGKEKTLWDFTATIPNFFLRSIFFRSVWILPSDVSEFRFYPLNFGGIWILHPVILKFQDVKSKHPQISECKIQKFLNFRSVICNL